MPSVKKFTIYYKTKKLNTLGNSKEFEMQTAISVIDIFAGPGGLSEGFSRVKNKSGKLVFDIVLSIEKDPFAHSTLKLRTLFRELQKSQSSGLKSYYSYIRGEKSIEDLYKSNPIEADIADNKAWLAELGSESFPVDTVRQRISKAIGSSKDFILIGGPPCQAYSIVGRSRNKGIATYDPNQDKRQVLYREYLRILADHKPIMFVMENVKGMLSATLNNKKIVHEIVKDLQNPSRAFEDIAESDNEIGYKLFSFVSNKQYTDGDLTDLIIHSEKFDIPQQRHRVIILGIRNDIPHSGLTPLVEKPPVNVNDVLSDLPKLRSGLSKQQDSSVKWIESISKVLKAPWFKRMAKRNDLDLHKHLLETIETIKLSSLDRGGMFISGKQNNASHLSNWFIDKNIGGVTNHETRSHIESDLYRYLFASCYAQAYGYSPTLKQYPKEILPNHKNAHVIDDPDNKNTIFGDRFRVQVKDKPATTITSHISKDGHYYIHPDPTQCRSLTVREAARIQTFPDNYFFCGPRTSQYHQVGNAVPPYLAYQIAQIVFDINNRRKSEKII